MRNILVGALAATFSFMAPAYGQQTTPMQVEQEAAQDNSMFVDMVIWGGPIYTADDDNPTVEAVAIKNGRFVYIGNRVDVDALAGDNTAVIDLSGAALYPGFVDAHAHLQGIGERGMTMNLEGVVSIAAMQERLKVWIDTHEGDGAIEGRGWIETHWLEKRFPSRWDLDAVESERPVILERSDGHALVANSAALKAAGISGDTEPPFGGAILKNALGEPTGILVDAAKGFLATIMRVATDDKKFEALKVGGDVYAAYGWTGLHNMGASWQGLGMMEELSDEGVMGIRVYNSVDIGVSQTLLDNGPRASDNGRIITRAIKMYVDGALGSRGAALIEPYSDADTHGLVQAKAEDVLPIMRRALRDGIQVNTHAIGDGGNRKVLDWYEQVFNEIPASERQIAEPRWRDEHSQIIHPDDIPRFKSLGVIPSMQPSHAIGDLHFAPDRLGDERLYGAYAWRSLIDSGVIIPGGSDAPVERGDPLIEYYAAVARSDLSGFQGPNWHAEEAVSRDEALKMFTLWPAIASFQEEDLGTIEVGKKADLTAFSVDIMTVDFAEIPKAHAVLTIVDGDIIYVREDASE